VVVELSDENDHRPKFSTVYYEGEIREDSGLGTLVLGLHAQDFAGDRSRGNRNTKNNHHNGNQENKALVLLCADPDYGTNAALTYSIIEDEEMRKVFRIDPFTGALSLVTSLDYEKKESYVFHVKATDGGGLISSNIATVNVSVVNVNDNKPIVQSARVELFTPTAEGMLVHRIVAMDADGDDLRFNISRGNVHQLFTVDPVSGEIQVAKAVSLTEAKHILEVSVWDGRFTTLATITVHVKPLVKNPMFRFRNETFQAQVMENSTKVINLMSLMVLGSRMNENVRFKILNPSPYFGITRTSGVIFSTGERLDREQMAEHNLLVEVSIC